MLKKEREERSLLNNPRRMIKVSISVQRSLSIRRIRSPPEIALCGWTHHQTLGEVVWDLKGCNLTITKGEDTWLITMDKHDQEEGEEYIVEMVSTKWTEGNSVNIIRIGPTLAPGQERTVTTVTATVTACCN